MGYASIFNDVIGPVMRGPSSSHAAAAFRIGQLIRMSLSEPIVHVTVGFDPRGSLAKTHDGQGSDMGLFGGLLGLSLEDPRVEHSVELAEEEGIQVSFVVEDYENDHPNYYHITVETSSSRHVWEAISVGGGMIQVQKIDGFDVELCGEAYELLIVMPNLQRERVREQIAFLRVDPSQIRESQGREETMLHLRRATPFEEEERLRAAAISESSWCCVLEPVLPITGDGRCQVPFSTASQLLEDPRSAEREMWQMAVLYESQRGGISEEEVFQKMRRLLHTIQDCVKQGVQGTVYSDRILGAQAPRLAQAAGSLIPSALVNTVIRNISAIMEMKSSMGVIVAAPTAGSCGCLPGTLTAVAQVLGLEEEKVVQGLLAAGLVGIFVSEQATFSAEVAGCQAECGAGSAMAAAGLVQMMGGTVAQCLAAASIALQSVTGLVCDPVANRVEVPCLNKNIMGGVNAISSANMALAGFDPVIPLDETIRAMYDIGRKLPSELRCTCGGLGKTRTAQEIEKQLMQKKK